MSSGMKIKSFRKSQVGSSTECLGKWIGRMASVNVNNKIHIARNYSRTLVVTNFPILLGQPEKFAERTPPDGFG